MQPELPIVPPHRLDAVPEHMRAGILGYAERGHPTGGFLQALLSGDIVGAGLRADPQNTDALSAWVDLLKALPPECHGSPEAYRYWIHRGGYLGRDSAAA